MKILLVHNFYQSSSPSGEDAVFRNEVELLKKNGIDVITYEKHNDEIKDYGLWGKVHLVFQNIWSRKAYQDIKNLIKKEKPDIAHFHNIWYLISPSAYSACKDAGVPVVQTLHNFRMFCVNGLLLRDGRVCEECISAKKGDRDKDYGVRGKGKEVGDRKELGWKIVKNAVRYGCYRDSRLYSFAIASANAIHMAFGTWEKNIDAFIALTEFGKKKFVGCGLPEEKIFVKPNFLLNPPEPSYAHRDYIIFLGRLSHEKGLSILIDAAKTLNNSAVSLKFKIVGDGPLMKELKDKVKAEKISGIEFTGRKTFHECMELLRDARFMMMPAVCYENFPMAIREAFACGKPVIASNLGAMAELVEDGKTGLLFEPGNAEDLAVKIRWMLKNEDACIAMGKNARKEFEEKYTAEKNFQILTGIYQTVSADGLRGKD
jgi:glycosyltransferase involved in cell wall biosynthesis